MSNLGHVPIDIIIIVMKKVVSVSFTDFFNLFKAWARAQRRSTVVRLMEALPLHDLYWYADAGSAADTSSFRQFFGIAVDLGMDDAILF